MSQMINPELEQQYNNRAAIQEHPAFLQSWADRSSLYRQQRKADYEVSYGGSPRQVMDIFPAKQDKAPVHVFIHGGYWQDLSKDSFSFMAKTFNDHNECAVILNYDLCPIVSVERICEQIQLALRWIVEHIGTYGGDPDRIQLTGHSAGGHLLTSALGMDWSSLGKQYSPFKRLNAISGVYDLQPLLATSINQALGLNEVTAGESSPMKMTPQSIEPATELNLFVGELESDSFKEQSRMLQDSWGQSMTINYQVIPDVHHFSILDTFLNDYYQPLV